MAIKGSSSSSSKSLFLNLNKGKHTCLMAKESRRKVKPKASPPKYISSDDEINSSDKEDEDEEALVNDMSKNPKAKIKGLLCQVGLHDELLEQQERLLIQEKESNKELKRLLNFEKDKREKLNQELAQSKETISSLKSSSGALQDSYNVLQKTHKDLKMQFDALWSSTSKPSNNNEASTSQVSVETWYEAIAQENDYLKLQVKRLEQIVSELLKQAKVWPYQDNCRNMVNKLEKGSTVTKQASQQSNKSQPLKKQWKSIEDWKLEYARSASHQEWHWVQGGRQAQFKSEQQWQRIDQVH
jgi:chromosome segregation ATPase